MTEASTAMESGVPASAGPDERQGATSSAARLRDRMFGVALFFSGLEILFEGQPQMLDTYRRQCRNLIQRGNAALDQVERVAAGEPADMPDLAGVGVEAAENRQVLERADVLVAAYTERFPGRDRSEALSRDEMLTLMEAAALRAGG